MKHKCTVCKKIYDSDSAEIINGCICGNKKFFYVNDSRKKNFKIADSKNNSAEYFYELEDDENNEIIAFDIESVNIIENGKYEIDVESLINNKSCQVYKYGDGKYSINIENMKKTSKHLVK